MSQTLYAPGEAASMMKIMCERVDLSERAGRYIMSMVRLNTQLPGDLVDMVMVANAIKYASEHQEDLKPQFTKDGWRKSGTVLNPTNTRTWYKPAN